jgi:predicted alpha/beta superfamily hydrolase
MINKINTSFLFLLISINILGQETTRKIEEKEINSVVFDTIRKFSIYLPYQYFDEPTKKFPVIYLFDSQSEEMFDLGSSIVGYLSSAQLIKPMIVVGIKTEDRFNEFLPKNKYDKTQEKYQPPMGNAGKLIKHLNDEVFPFINKNYRALSTKIGIGHSLAATFLTYNYIEYPKMFDAVINISPNLDYDQEQLINKLKEFKQKETKINSYYYIAYGKIGNPETRFYPATEKAIKLFSSKGISIDYDTMENENHSSIVPFAIEKGLLQYDQFIFLTPKNTIDYYENLEKKGEILLQANEINMLAYGNFRKNKINNAIEIIEWGINKFPNEDNLYDSMGEFQEKKGNISAANSYYQKAIEIIKERMLDYKKSDYEEKIALYRNNLKRTNK